MTNQRTAIRDHFAGLAGDYDGFKQRNRRYYDHLKRLYRHDFSIPPGARVLEVGCGTGEILASLNPAFGVGVDIVPQMVEIAARKFAGRPELSFITGEAEALPVQGPFDWIVVPDVLEHLHDLDAALAEFARVTGSGSRLVLSWANPLWEPVLRALEKLRMKMPEGPHNFHSPAAVISRLRALGLEPGMTRDRFPFGSLPAWIDRRLQRLELRRGRLFRGQLILAVMFSRP